MKTVLFKNVCCTTELTLATKFIAFVGILISVLLVTVVLNDKAVGKFAISRAVALALGLDWRHFHHRASTAEDVDPEGKMISILMIFYSVAYLLTNLLLLLAAVLQKRWLAWPWLLCELLGCLSKIGALIFHLVSKTDKLSNTFIWGSVIYIVVIIWWWLAVFGAQHSMKFKKNEAFALSLISIVGRENTTMTVHDTSSQESKMSTTARNESAIESPVPYVPNECYTFI